MKLLCHLCHRLLDFRQSEVESVAELMGCEEAGFPGGVAWDLPFGGHPESPFWYTELPDEQTAAKIASRAVLVKGFYEVWGEGATWEELSTAVKSFDTSRMVPFLAEGTTFKIEVDTWGHTFSHERTMACIDSLTKIVTFKGKVNLKNPQHVFTLIHSPDPAEGTNNGLPSDLVPERWYFGRQVSVSDRSIINRYDLSKRDYIGTTSMDPELAIIMCNCGKVKSGDLVYDPFVGTGGILVAATHYGGVTLGMDIDIRVVSFGRKNKGKAVNIYSNFQQYKLSDPAGLLRADTHRPPFRKDFTEWIDAIVCDPPYGVRESARKSEYKETKIDDRKDNYIPSTQPYFLGECLYDLVEFAAKALRVGGRLVFWMPSAPGLYEETELPLHPVMRLMHNCEQHLSSRYTRRMLVMQKMRPLDSEAAETWEQQRGDAIMKINIIPKRVFEVLEKDEEGNPSHPEWLTQRRPFRGKYV
mmetsp:Transcript_24229/g.67365  ORF Transcript_24229/g.67365 Transcript_24229/m.67365 type:complete len:471 (+) Transcript_24229:348-1760(+)